MEEKINVLCYSTEEMCASIEDVNRRREDIRKLVILSMDVEKLYPSIVAEEFAKVVTEEFLKARLEVEVDDVELGLYLVVAM